MPAMAWGGAGWENKGHADSDAPPHRACCQRGRRGPVEPNYRVSVSRSSNNWFVVVMTCALPRYAVEARIRFTRLVPMSVFDSSKLPDTIVPMPCVPGDP